MWKNIDIVIVLFFFSWQKETKQENKIFHREIDICIYKDKRE